MTPNEEIKFKYRLLSNSKKREYLEELADLTGSKYNSVRQNWFNPVCKVPEHHQQPAIQLVDDKLKESNININI